MKLQLAYDLGTYEELYPFMEEIEEAVDIIEIGTPVILSCLLYTSPSPRDVEESRMPSSA